MRSSRRGPPRRPSRSTTAGPDDPRSGDAFEVIEDSGECSFADLGLLPELLRAIEDEGYTNPTPIQRRSIPSVLEGRDVLGCAQTGTGKTAAFVLPMLQRLNGAPTQQQPRGLVVTPTRELAAQIGERTECYGEELRLRHQVIFGGVSQRRQEDSLRRRPQIIIATPGRLLDLLNQGHLTLSKVNFLVLDEADRMLDMGFLPDVRRILAAVAPKRQTLLFSATMPPGIKQLARSILHDPAFVAVSPDVTTAETVEQSVYLLDRAGKVDLLIKLLRPEEASRVLVFTRTKHGADRLVKKLSRANIQAAAIHGNKSQNNRLRALKAFRDGSIGVMVATDVAARGIDVDGISHVINYDLPNIPDSYVHRIGRTGRAGAQGRAISFCDGEERAYLRDIERFIKRKLPIAEDLRTPEMVRQQEATPPTKPPQRRGRHSGRPQGGGGPQRRRRGGRGGRGPGAPGRGNSNR